MSSYRKKPDRLEGMAARRLLDALGSARQAVISAQTQVKVAGPVYHGCQMVTSAIDALAQLITGSPPEDLREVISAYQKCVAEIVRRFGGFVAKYMGDGVLVYFGYPQAT